MKIIFVKVLRKLKRRIIFVLSFTKKRTTMKNITTERLLEIVKEEVAKYGAGVYTERRRIAIEMLRMKGIVV